MSLVAAGVIAAGTVGAAAISANAKSKVKSRSKILQTPGEGAARSFLADRLANPIPQPTRQIVGLTEPELAAKDLSQQFGEAPSEGGKFLSSVLQQDPDILSDPTFRALFDETKRAGQEETNRVGRSIQLRGGASSTTGRDELGRSVAQNQQNLLATLAPAALQRQEQRLRVAQLSDDSILKRLNALSATGGLERSLAQLAKDATFQKQLAVIQAPIDTAQAILGNPATIESTQTIRPSSSAQIAAGLNAGIGAFGQISPGFSQQPGPGSVRVPQQSIFKGATPA